MNITHEHLCKDSCICLIFVASTFNASQPAATSADIQRMGGRYIESCGL